MAVLTLVQALNQALAQEMERDHLVMLLGQDIGRLGGVFRVTDGLQARFGADRVVDMPLAESVIAGSALGLAVSGLRPVAEIQFLGFAHQAFDQISDQIARYRFRSQGRFELPLVIRAVFGGGVRTPELHSDGVEAQFVHCPGLKVAMPSTAYDAKGMLLAAIRDPDPVLFCEPARSYRQVRGEVPDEDYIVPLGVARVAREGTAVTVIAWSSAVRLALEAAERSGVDCEVLDLRTLSPLDVDAIAASVDKTGRAVVVHEAVQTAGFGAEVVATIQEEAFYALEAPVARVTAPDIPYPLAGAEADYLPSVEQVAAAIERVVRER